MNNPDVLSIQSIQSQINLFLYERTNGMEIDKDDDIFLSGYVNSLITIQMVIWIEERFNVKIVQEDLDVANFRTVNLICDFIQRKLEQS